MERLSSSAQGDAQKLEGCWKHPSPSLPARDVARNHHPGSQGKHSMGFVDTLWGCRGLANADVLAVTESNVESVISHPISSKSAGDQVCLESWIWQSVCTVLLCSWALEKGWTRPFLQSFSSHFWSSPRPDPLFRITNMCYSLLRELIQHIYAECLLWALEKLQALWNIKIKINTTQEWTLTDYPIPRSQL